MEHSIRPLGEKNIVPIEIRSTSRDWRDYSFGNCLNICVTPALGTHIHFSTCVHCGNGVWSTLTTIIAINLQSFPHFVNVSGQTFVTPLRVTI